MDYGFDGLIFNIELAGGGGRERRGEKQPYSHPHPTFSCNFVTQILSTDIISPKINIIFSNFY